MTTEGDSDSKTPRLVPNQTLYVNNLNEKLKKDGIILGC